MDNTLARRVTWILVDLRCRLLSIPRVIVITTVASWSKFIWCESSKLHTSTKYTLSEWTLNLGFRVHWGSFSTEILGFMLLTPSLRTTSFFYNSNTCSISVNNHLILKSLVGSAIKHHWTTLTCHYPVRIVCYPLRPVVSLPWQTTKLGRFWAHILKTLILSSPSKIWGCSKHLDVLALEPWKPGDCRGLIICHKIWFRDFQFGVDMWWKWILEWILDYIYTAGIRIWLE